MSEPFEPLRKALGPTLRRAGSAPNFDKSGMSVSTGRCPLATSATISGRRW